ncbi:MAG TPA: MTH1187 family thiamine-binding protein [Blastocatellia bacterium]|nr:MTH1187 family thiamine-binding protein [Blastocatellia bacterium]
MLVELSINPLGRGAHISRDLAAILKLIDDSGLRYVLTPFGTCIEGQWDEIMPLVKRCHDQARTLSPHVLTTIRIEDEEAATDKLHENIASVERAAGRELRRLSQVWVKEGAAS